MDALTPRILVTGSQGQVGHEIYHIAAKLLPQGEFLFTNRQTMDLSNLTQVEDIVTNLNPHIIINAGAYTAVDQAEDEPELAFKINAELPTLLAKLAKKHHALLIHYSTDYVFDGNKTGFYKEEDATNPLSVYGQSKREGEKGICENGEHYVILRTSWVYSAQGKNFLKTILRLANEREELSIVNDQHGAPTPASWLAEVGLILAERYINKQKIPAGIYHAVSQGETTWFDYACLILNSVKKNNVRVIPVPSEAFPTKAQRPRNSKLCTQKIQQLGVIPPHWQEAVQELLRLEKNAAPLTSGEGK